MNVEHVMTRGVVTVNPEMPLRDVAKLLTTHRISGAPVCDSNGRVLGVVSARDILFQERGDRERAGALYLVADVRAYEARAKSDARNAGEAMTAPAVTIEPERRVYEAARLMLDRDVNRLPVVRDGDLVGIVSRGDLVRAFARSDAHIVREITNDVLEAAFPLEPEVRVDVAGGEVTLTGEVETRSDARRIEQLVARVPGVISVADRLTWRLEDEVRGRQPTGGERWSHS